MANDGTPKFICDICGAELSSKSNLTRHRRGHGNKDEHKCSLCSYATDREDNLQRHYWMYHKAPLKRTHFEMNGVFDDKIDPNIPGPSGVQPQATNDTAETSGIKSNTNQSSQVMPDKENSQISSPKPAQQPIQSNPLGPLDPEELTDREERIEAGIQQLLEQNKAYIKTFRRNTRRIEDRYNFELMDLSPTQLERYLRQILADQRTAFKINAAFGFILVNSVTDQPIYYYASRNNRILESPMLIRNAGDVERFMDRFRSLDLLEYARQQRPNTKFTVRSITNVLFYVDKLLDFPVGGSIELPQFITGKKCIMLMNKDQAGELFGDNYCLFRCYDYHLNGKKHSKMDDIIRLAKPFCSAHKISMSPFHGLPLGKLYLFENFYEVNIAVYKLEELPPNNTNGNCEVKARQVVASRRVYADTMYLNLYERHYSYINDIRTYSKIWECRWCRKLFNRRYDMEIHVRACNTTTQLLFPGGGYGQQKTIFDLLKEHGITLPNEDMKFYPFRCSYDYEALSVPITDDRGTKEKFLCEQVPLSVSVCSNVPGYTDAKCFISDGDPAQIVADMYCYMQEISIAAYDIMCGTFQTVIAELESYNHEHSYLMERADQLTADGNPQEEVQPLYDEAYRLMIYKSLSIRLEEWMSHIPVLGFNSGKYDMNLIRRYLFPYLLANNIKVDKIIKRGNHYLSITTPHVLLLDVIHYVAAGTSYSMWLKANDVQEQKGFFPYGYLTSIDKLKETRLPPKEVFWSELRQEHISQENYVYLQQVWKDKKFKTLRDLLEWYNNLDVVPFLVAADRMFQMWKGQGVDCFKQRMISLPGLALAYLVKEMEPHTILPLFDKNSQDIYDTIRKNIVGGLSIVMHRHHEAGKTNLPNGAKCGWVYCHDANALYLMALGEKTGTGLFATWRPSNDTGRSTEWHRPDQRDPETHVDNIRDWHATVKDNMAIEFHRTRAYPYSFSEVAWMEWTGYKTGRKLEHRFNGRPKTIIVNRNINYRVDGFHPDTATVYQFHGCYWHGHGCRLDREKFQTARERRRTQTQEMVDNLRNLNFTVIEKWECEWMEDQHNDPEIYCFLEEHLNLPIRKNKLTGTEIVKAIETDEIFGLIECDIEVEFWNDQLLDFFEEFPPICKNIELSRADLGEKMRQYAIDNGYMQKPTRCLINSYFGRRILLSTPLVKWYLQHGLRISRIFQVIEMKPKDCFANIRDDITEHRRRADRDPTHKSASEGWKTVGNSMYGKSMTRKEDQKDTILAADTKASHLVNSKRFNKLEEVGETAYEVTEDKDKIKLDLPLTVAFFVYNYAKKRMLEFVYGFLKRYLRPGSYQLVCSDTDSILAAYESKDLDSLVKDDLRDEYHRIGKPEFLVTDEYSKRTPGKFKVERSGKGVTALCSKTYIHWNEPDDVKISSKGLSKRTNNFSRTDFDNVIQTKVKGSGTNYGFKIAGDRLLQYKQKRDGLSYFYAKRQVQDDGVSTRALYV